jgi:hypothetical protein
MPFIEIGEDFLQRQRPEITSDIEKEYFVSPSISLR